MKIYYTSCLVAVASLFGGFLIAMVAGQLPANNSLLLSSAGLILAVSALIAQTLFLKRAFTKLQAFATRPTAEAPNCGFSELNTIADRIATNFRSHELQDQSQASRPDTNLLEALESRLNWLESQYAVNPAPQHDLTQRIEHLLGVAKEQAFAELQQAVSCSREIGKGAQQLVVNADEQTDRVNRITDVIESLSAEIIGLGENVEGAMESSTTAQQFAIGGLDEFEDILRELEVVKSHVSTRERKMQMLSQHSREIGNIVQSVGALSSRTDLLALNASIESARAGEYGRGFALVAEEVRELADQSARSVADISEKVDLIQQETQDSVAVAFGEHDQIKKLIGRLNTTLKSMRKMSDASNQCATKVTDISERNQQQLQMLTQIVNELESSSEISKSNRIQAEGVHWTARTLQQLGDKLGEASKASAV